MPDGHSLDSQDDSHSIEEPCHAAVIIIVFKYLHFVKDSVSFYPDDCCPVLANCHYYLDEGAFGSKQRFEHR